MFLRGYFSGKRYAERVLFETFPEGGVALRPGFIHGTRNVRGIGVPLSAIGEQPLPPISFLPSVCSTFPTLVSPNKTMFLWFACFEKGMVMCSCMGQLT